MKVRSISSAKSFAMVGGLFTIVECGIDKVRGKKDMKTTIASGFTSGAVIAARAGPTAMIIGGSGFAAFSVIIEMLSPYIFGG